ncbi:YsnF/AvaK domain-containing protein [Allosphingosinicella sp.]|uniref:YsnF/AvaK domain-containing protein n=1 Tax=Allosphingosinicella sp. TaxID=2823234 RepID=UPI002EDF0247
MSRTVTAMFDSRSQAEAARERLTQSRIDAGDVRIVDQSASASSSDESDEGQGLWSAIKAAFIPPEDSHSYEEGMRRGGYLLCARVDEDKADEAIRILDESDSVDLDERENSWRSEGWSPYQATAGASGFQQNEQLQQTDRTVAEERIPIVEEELRVGKREVERGGARVRSYVTQTPVSEQVNLREEHVSVERRPVDREVSQSELQGDMMQDSEISMTETAEEAVVGKEARVREELVVRKTAEEHTETVQDNVRHTEVDVDEGVRETAGRSAFGSFGGNARSGDLEERSSSESFEDSDKSRY